MHAAVGVGPANASVSRLGDDRQRPWLFGSGRQQREMLVNTATG